MKIKKQQGMSIIGFVFVLAMAIFVSYRGFLSFHKHSH